jgi:uncharacterized protein YlaI
MQVKMIQRRKKIKICLCAEFKSRVLHMHIQRKNSKKEKFLMHPSFSSNSTCAYKATGIMTFGTEQVPSEEELMLTLKSILTF